jgi:hypothetical protein
VIGTIEMEGSMGQMDSAILDGTSNKMPCGGEVDFDLESLEKLWKAITFDPILGSERN